MIKETILNCIFGVGWRFGLGGSWEVWFESFCCLMWWWFEVLGMMANMVEMIEDGILRKGNVNDALYFSEWQNGCIWRHWAVILYIDEYCIASRLTNTYLLLRIKLFSFLLTDPARVSWCKHWRSRSYISTVLMTLSFLVDIYGYPCDDEVWFPICRKSVDTTDRTTVHLLGFISAYRIWISSKWIIIVATNITNYQFLIYFQALHWWLLIPWLLTLKKKRYQKTI